MARRAATQWRQKGCWFPWFLSSVEVNQRKMAVENRRRQGGSLIKVGAREEKVVVAVGNLR